MENNDKAKKILFGTTELPDNPETKMNEDEMQLFKDYFLWPTEWFDAVVAYCREQKIDPTQLIEQHSYWAKMAHELHKEAIEKASKDSH